MLVQYMSDLHLEFGDMDIPEKKGDVLVLAGDIHVGTKGAEWINRCAEKFKDVVFLFGDHEFYNNNLTHLTQSFPKLLHDNVHVLDNTAKEIQGRLFVGSTLWADMLPQAFYSMDDSRLIDYITAPMTLENVEAMFLENLEAMFLENLDFLVREAKEDCVIVTHHAPSKKSIDLDRYGDTLINTGYYTEILHLFDDRKPAVWIHGHTRSISDYVNEGIHVVCNCRGYVGREETIGFDSNKIIEV